MATGGGQGARICPGALPGPVPLLEMPTLAEVDPKGDSSIFEKRVSKAVGGRGFAYVAWEYTGRGKNLNVAKS